MLRNIILPDLRVIYNTFIIDIEIVRVLQFSVIMLYPQYLSIIVPVLALIIS